MSDELKTIEQKGIDEAGARLQRNIDHATALEVVQRVIAGVERAVLCVVSESYDKAPAIAVARSLKKAIKEKDTALIAELEDHFSTELYMWRLSLCSRDQAIQPYHLRRFCEKTEEHLELPVFAALTRFYRNLPHTELSQSKYDFAVTRLFASVEENNQRTLRMEGERLVESISEMSDTWGEKRRLAPASPDEIRKAVGIFRSFISEAENGINKFEKLIGSGLFNRVRVLKKDLGELFYAPEVTAAAIECNVVVANKFTALLADEGEQIREAPAACRDLTDILSDTTAIASMSKVLDELQLAELEQQAESNEQLSQLLRLLRISNDYSEAKPSQDETEGDQPSHIENDGVAGELSLTLRGLAEDDDNKEIISEFLRTPLSEERQSLDPAIFLAPLAEVEPGDRQEERQARRDSLSLILRSERLLRFKLSNDNPISAETETELSALLEEMQQTASILRRLISEARASSQLPVVDQLLHVSNHLLGARLRLQSAIVQLGAGELARQDLANKKAEIRPESKLPFRVKRKKQLLAVAAVLLIAFAGFVVRAFHERSAAAVAHRDKDVQMLDVKELPGPELLVNARLKSPLLVAVVSTAWANSPDDKKREELEALLRFGKPIGVDTVMLVDSSGAQQGSVSASHLSLE